MNPTSVISSEGVKTQANRWGFPLIPDFSLLWGKYRTTHTDEFDKADGFDVQFPFRREVDSKSDIIDIPGPLYEENLVDNQANSCLHGILEENANLKGKRDRKKKQRQDKVASPTYNEPTRRSNRLVQNAPKIEGTKADTIAIAMRCEQKRACIGHHSKKLNSKSRQAPDRIKFGAFPQPHVCLEQIVNVSHQCDSTLTPAPQTFTCPNCTKVCASKHHLQAHLVAKHNPSPVRCKFCGKLFGTEVSLKKHQAYKEACRKAQRAFFYKRMK